jgi:hypothetical protein
VAQLFRPGANTILRLALFAAVLGPLAGFVLLGVLVRSPFATGEGVTVDQPVPFSHQHHAGELGIDCRFCHQSVETAAFAGMPSTKTCMACHSQLWTNAAMLAPVRESMATGVPLVWNKVNRLPGYVYFDHHVHVRNGVPCVACHGDVRTMPLLRQAAPLTMGWCLDCHRNPAPHIVPPDRILASDSHAGLDAAERAALQAQLRKVGRDAQHLTDCSVCHR